MVAVDLNGDEKDMLVAAFEGYGLYTKDSVDGWLQINQMVPENIIRSHNSLACDFGEAYGLWLWDQTGGR